MSCANGHLSVKSKQQWNPIHVAAVIVYYSTFYVLLDDWSFANTKISEYSHQQFLKRMRLELIGTKMQIIGAWVAYQYCMLHKLLFISNSFTEIRLWTTIHLAHISFYAMISAIIYYTTNTTVYACLTIWWYSLQNCWIPLAKWL